MQTQSTTRKLSELRPHPASLDIYGKNEDVKDLVESIRANGVLVPLTVKPDGVILSGNRRYQAAKDLELEEVPCVTAEPKTPEEEEIFIIEANRNRKKDVIQLYNEGIRLTAAYAALAKKRHATRVNCSSSDIENGSCLVNASVALSKTETLKGYEKGQTYAAVAQAIGMKTRTWQRLKRIGEFADLGNETALELLRRIDNEDLPIGKAERILRQALKATDSNGEPEREKTLLQICVEQAEKNARQLLRALDEITGLPDEQYNPFACDCLFDTLDFVVRAVEKLNKKDDAHEKAGSAKQSENKKEDAA